MCIPIAKRRSCVTARTAKRELVKASAKKKAAARADFKQLLRMEPIPA
jgi:hypothetical protein